MANTKLIELQYHANQTADACLVLYWNKDSDHHRHALRVSLENLKDRIREVENGYGWGDKPAPELPEDCDGPSF